MQECRGQNVEQMQECRGQNVEQMQECRGQNVEQMQLTVKNITIFYCADYQPMPLPSPVDQRHF